MSTGLVIHISSGEDKHTEVLTDERIRIGSCDDCDLRLSSMPNRPDTNGIVLELARSNGYYKVAAFDHSLNLTLNGKPLEPDAPIEDGDEVRLDQSSLALKFFPIRSLPAVVPGSARETHV